LLDKSESGVDADEDELDVLTKGQRMDVTTGIPRTRTKGQRMDVTTEM
jgi:hypothetical protein